MIEEALALHRAGQLVGSRRLCRRILEAQPDHPEALRLPGMLEAQRGNAVEARPLLGRSKGVHPESAAAYEALGDIQRTMRRFDAALASYDRALAIEPGLALAHFNRALTLQTLCRLADALSSCDAAVALDPALPEAWNHRGSLADYEALALTLARDPARMASLKATLARHRESHPLFDTGRFCRHLEAAYEAMLDAKVSKSSGA